MSKNTRADQNDRSIKHRSELLLTSELKDGKYPATLKTIYDKKPDGDTDYASYKIVGGTTFLMGGQFEGKVFPKKCNIVVEDGKVLKIKGE